MDTQTVTTSANVAEESQGIDPGKRIKGRKRYLATDALGLLLVLMITAGNVHDTVGGRRMVDRVAAHHPNVAKVWVDGTCEALPARSRTMVHWAMVDVMSRRLTEESAPSWRKEPTQTDNKS